MISIPVLLTSINASITIARAVADASTQYSQAELKLKMADIMSTLADAKIALAEAKEQLDAKDKKIESLSGAFKRLEETIEINGTIYKKGPDGKPTGRPLCSVCIQKDGVQMVIEKNLGSMGGFRCPACKAQFGRLATY